MSFSRVFPPFSVDSQVETYFRLEVSPMHSVCLAVGAVQAEAVWGVCDNFFLTSPSLVLRSLIDICSLLSLPAAAVVSPEGEWCCKEWDRIAADPQALSWGQSIPSVGSSCFALVLMLGCGIFKGRGQPCLQGEADTRFREDRVERWLYLSGTMSPFVHIFF